jgi:hypothetical protein
MAQPIKKGDILRTHMAYYQVFPTAKKELEPEMMDMVLSQCGLKKIHVRLVFLMNIRHNGRMHLIPLSLWIK